MTLVTFSGLSFTLAFVFAATAPENGAIEIHRAPLVLDSAAEPVTLSGVVADGSGAPLAGAAVRWWEYERPEGLRNLDQRPAAEAREDGSFSVTLPRADIRYMVQFDAPGFETATVSHFGPPATVRATLQPRPGDPERVSRVTGQISLDGAPTAGTVILRTRADAHDRSIASDSTGSFQFDVPFQRDPRAVVHAAAAGLVSAYRNPMPGAKPMALELGDPGVLQGQVVDVGEDAPIPGCQVLLITGYAGVPFRTTESDGEGRFRVEGLPPGPYRVRITHPRYYDSTSNGKTRLEPSLDVEAGKSTAYRATLTPKTEISGVVLDASGRPVAGAWVGMEPRISIRSDGHNPLERVVELPAAVVKSDEAGRFSLYTHRNAITSAIEAYHPLAGIARESIQIPGAGGSIQNAEVQLSGVFRLRGFVAGDSGEPIPGVRMGAMTSGEDGQFDSGIVAVPDLEDGALPLNVVAPRPAPDQSTGARTASTETYYLHRTLSLQPAPGEQLAIEVALRPTRTLALHGVVTDADGNPVTDAELSVKPWDTHSYGWIPRDGASRSILTGSAPHGFPDPTPSLGYRTRSDRDGAWRLLFPLETPISLLASHARQGGGPEGRANMSLLLAQRGVEATLRAAHRERGLEITTYLRDLATVPDKYEIALNFDAPQAQPESFIRARVVDDKNDPIEGVEWSTPARGGTETVRTGPDGMLVLERQRQNRITLQTEGWTIISPEPAPPAMIDFKFVEGPQPHTIVLARLGGVEFHFHHPGGAPADAYVTLGGERADSDRDRDTGVVRARGLHAGQHKFTITTREGFRIDHTTVVPPGKTVTERIEIPEADCTVVCQLRGPDGAPQPGLSVELTGPDYVTSERSDADGRVTFHAPPGIYALTAMRDGIPCVASGHGVAVEVARGQRELSVELPVTPPPPGDANSDHGRPACLTVQLAAQNTAMAAGILLTLKSRAEAQVKWTGVTDQTGYHTFENILPGTYELSFEPGGALIEEWVYTLPVEPESRRIHRIPLNEGHTVQGYARGIIPDNDTSIMLVSHVAGLTVRAKPGADGGFWFDHVPAGPATLFVHHNATSQRLTRAINVGPALPPLHIDRPEIARRE
ncbi:MAG: carboxypeptidase regulatory-like domain-containing protein [Candidatus Hydrogenedentes bacterium]|nr:carboxypeptidase regulatory-like domain-containing protein [Candidatus Hydrogenedentota bacterium]